MHMRVSNLIYFWGIIFFLQAFHKNKTGEWSKANTFGNAALYVSIAAWIYTLVITLLILIPHMVLLYIFKTYRANYEKP